MVMAKDGEVAHSFQPLMGVSRSFFWGLMEAKWPIRRSRPKNLLKNVIACCVGCALAFLLLEVLLRIYNPFPIRIKGDEIILPIHQKHVVTNTQTDKLDREIIHRKNSLGFRGPEPPKSFGAYTTVVAVGGSTTECYYLSDGKDWPALLQNRLRQHHDKIWINNAGLDGHSTFGHAILVRDYLANLKPDYLLFLVGANDVGRSDLGHYDKKNIRQAHAGWQNSLVKWSEVLSLVYSLSKSFKAFQKGLSHRFPNLKQLPHAPLDHLTMMTKLGKHNELLVQYKDRLTQLMRMTIDTGIQPILVTQPTLVGTGVDDVTGVNLETIQLGGKNGKAYWHVLQAYNRVTQSVGKKLNIPVINLDQRMPKSSRYFYDRLHFTNEGAELVSSILAKALQPHLFHARVPTSK